MYLSVYLVHPINSILLYQECTSTCTCIDDIFIKYYFKKKCFRLSNSVVFRRIWKKQGQKEETKKGEHLTLVEVIESVWKNTQKKWKNLEEKLVSGEISFKEFWNYFQSISHDDLEQQLQYFSTNTDKGWIKERLRQFDQYRNLKQCANGAQTILKAVDAYHFQGDFQPIRMIVEMVLQTISFSIYTNIILRTMKRAT